LFHAAPLLPHSDALASITERSIKGGCHKVLRSLTINAPAPAFFAKSKIDFQLKIPQIIAEMLPSVPFVKPSLQVGSF
jgi:hypothetical protein